jgi:hypothetical protein
MDSQFSSAASSLPLPLILDSFKCFRCVIASVEFKSSWERDQNMESAGIPCDVGINLGDGAIWCSLSGTDGSGVSQIRS